MADIVVNHVTRDIRLSSSDRNITVKQVTRNVKLASVGRRGQEGPPGPPASNIVTSVNDRIGDVSGLAEQADLISHVTDITNPHSVTKEQVGLGNVDNTSDIDKPIPDSVTAALALKVAKGELIFNVKDYGALGNGVADDTAAINAAIVAANGGTIRIPNGVHMVRANVPGTASPFFLGNEGGIELLDNTHIIMDKGAVLQAFPTSQGQYVILRAYNKTNITITGGTIRGERDLHTGSTGEWGYGLAITSGSDITVYDTQFENCWGDGINLQRIVSPLSVPTRVHLYNVTSDGNRRQGMSIEGASDFLAVGCTFQNTGGVGGTPPGAGVDIEPVADGIPVEDITFISCKFLDNTGTGVTAMHDGIKNLIIDGCLFDGNQDVEAQFKTYVPVGARDVKVVNSTFRNALSAAKDILLQGGSNYLIANNFTEQRIYAGSGVAGTRIKNVKLSNNRIIPPVGFPDVVTWVLIDNADRVSVLDNDIEATNVTGSTATAYRVNASDNVTLRYGRLTNVPTKVSIVGASTNIITVDGQRKIDIVEQGDGYSINSNASVSTYLDMLVNGISRASIGKISNGDVEFKTATARNLLLSPGTAVVLNSKQIKTVADPTVAQDAATKNYVDTTTQPLIAAGTTAQYRRGDNTWQTLNQDAVPDGTTNKAYTAVEKTKLAAISGTNTGDQTASTVSNSPSGNIAATTVQAAINELDLEKAIDTLAAHLAGTETFTGAKTFSGAVNLNGSNTFVGASITGPLAISSNIRETTSDITASATLTTSSRRNQRIIATSSPIDVTLPSSTATGFIFRFLRIDATAQVVRILGTINGVANYTIPAQYNYVEVLSTSTSGTWEIWSKG